MEVQATSEFETLFPTFVLHKQWDMPKEFNDRLYDLAAADCVTHRVMDASDPRAIGDGGNHISHLRHNFLTDTIDPTIRVLTSMVSQAVREFLWAGFRYQHEGDIAMMSDTFWQRRSDGENLGIPTHAHSAHEIVCTYYPRLILDANCPDTPLKRGALRFYDPGGRGNRLWPCDHPQHHTRPDYIITPDQGSMVVFEGHVPHDSTFFEGDERMCIPVLCKLDLPNAHRHATISEIMEVQNGL